MKRNSLMIHVRNLMVAMTLASAFVLGACVMEEPDSDGVAETALESTVLSPSQESVQFSQDDFETEATCPLRWTCDSGIYYSTQSQCLAACGGATCYRDYDCSGSCFCP
jgi:hypothetical protein